MSINEAIRDHGGGATGHFYAWLKELFRGGHSCGLALNDLMGGVYHGPDRCSAILAAAREAGWILFDGPSPRIREIPRFDNSMRGDGWQQAIFAFSHAFTPNHGSTAAREWLAAGERSENEAKAREAVASPITYEVRDFSTKHIDEAIRHAVALFDVGADDVTVCATDSRPGTLTAFWLIGRVNQFGEFREI